jgi:hypothetical protein
VVQPADEQGNAWETTTCLHGAAGSGARRRESDYRGGGPFDRVGLSNGWAHEPGAAENARTGLPELGDPVERGFGFRHEATDELACRNELGDRTDPLPGRIALLVHIHTFGEGVAP